MNIRIIFLTLILFFQGMLYPQEGITFMQMSTVVATYACNMYSAHTSECTQVAIGLFALFLIRRLILNPLISTLIKYEKLTLLCSVLYYLTARVSPELLRKACYNNDTALALRCLKFNVNPNDAMYGSSIWCARADCSFPPHYDSRALHMACYHQNEALVKALIKYGANPNCLDYDLRHPLEFAGIGFQENIARIPTTRDAALENNICGMLIVAGGLPGYINIKEYIEKPGILPVSVNAERLDNYRESRRKEVREYYDPETRKKNIKERLGSLNSDELLTALLSSC